MNQFEKRDILFELYHNKITEDEAYDIFDSAVSYFHTSNDPTDPHDLVCLNIDEKSAINFYTFSEVARFRYEVWPDNVPMG